MVPHGYVRSTSSSSSSNSGTKNLIEESHQSAEKSRMNSTAIGQPSSTAIQIALVYLLHGAWNPAQSLEILVARLQLRKLAAHFRLNQPSQLHFIGAYW